MSSLIRCPAGDAGNAERGAGGHEEFHQHRRARGIGPVVCQHGGNKHHQSDWRCAEPAHLSHVSDNFHAESGPDGTPWTPLTPATIRARAKSSRSAVSILRDRGLLAGSIKFEVEADRARVGTVAPCAAIHPLRGTVQKAEGKRWMAGRRFAKRDKRADGAEVTIRAHRSPDPGLRRRAAITAETVWGSTARMALITVCSSLVPTRRFRRKFPASAGSGSNSLRTSPLGRSSSDSPRPEKRP